MPLGNPETYVRWDPALLSYDAKAPFGPDTEYPEYAFSDAGTCGKNRIYDAVRDYLVRFGGDREHIGTPEWNPLGHLAKPGDTVVIKPNWVKDTHSRGLPLDVVVTHPSVIRPIIDYLLIALRGDGRIIVGDAPIQSCDFGALCKRVGIDELIGYYCGRTPVSVELADFRREHATMSLDSVVVDRQSAAGDPNGYRAVDLGRRSMLMPITERSSKFRVTNYDPREMAQHHSRDRHEYLISGSVLKADLVFLMPKMKTHRKAGITAALKNSVGINGHKDWLPHHSRGSIARGGDEYLRPSVLKASADTLNELIDPVPGRNLKRALGVTSMVLHKMARVLARDKYFEGSWYGNDTVWRMVLDLNRALLYAGSDGVLRETPQRRVYFLVDGIIGGDGDGPINPTPRPCGLLLGGESAVAVDAVAASLMGFDWRKIPLVRDAFGIEELPLTDFDASAIRVRSNAPELDGLELRNPKRHFAFAPSPGWRDHVELNPRSAPASGSARRAVAANRDA